MKFSVQSNELQKCLTNVGGVIPSRSTLPILENFLFNLSDDNLSVTATDLDICMTVRLKVKGSENGWAAAVEYHIKKVAGENITQAQISKKYEISPSTLGKRYKDLKVS